MRVLRSAGYSWSWLRPYPPYVWAYDANDLVAVKGGQKNPWDVKPYAHWILKLPFDTGTNSLNGAVYDEVTNRLYISQARPDGRDRHPWRRRASGSAQGHRGGQEAWL